VRIVEEFLFIIPVFYQMSLPRIYAAIATLPSRPKYSTELAATIFLSVVDSLQLNLAKMKN